MKAINFNRIFDRHFSKFFNKNLINRYINKLNKVKEDRRYPLYFAGVVASILFIYLSIPLFFNYEKSKSVIENKIKNEFNLNSSINGKIKYKFFPYPHLEIKSLLIKDFVDENKKLGEVEKAILRISVKKLTSLKKMKLKKLKLQDIQASLNLSRFDKYREFFLNNFESKNIYISSGKIILFDEKKYLTELNNINFEYNSDDKIEKAILKAKFLDQNFVIKFKNKKDGNLSRILTIKFPYSKFIAKVKLFDHPGAKNHIDGHASIIYGQNKANLIFSWKNSLFKIKKGNIKNQFINGKIFGDISLNPFFDFNLDLDISSFNFKNLSKKIIELDDEKINNLINFNKKISGNMNLNINKIHSGHGLIKSMESKIRFINRDILIEKMLFDLGKLGAADITGMIKNNLKFVFKKNIFIDNVKYFYNKFGIYNKGTQAENLFVSGAFNLKRKKIYFNEVSNEKKIHKEDLIFYENQFNETLLEEGYKTLFNFLKLKEFVEIINSEAE